MMPDDGTPPEPYADLPPPATLGFALRRAQAAVAEDFNARFGPEDIRPAQCAVLTLLHHHPGPRQSQVSAALGIKRTNLVPLLDALERRGLIERRRVAGDRRAAALFLTDAGATTAARLATLAQAHEDRFSARLGADRHATLLGLLARLAEPGVAAR
jgi:DNA-binding MarR family transcriptional regulator